jgi:hypothetical protein
MIILFHDANQDGTLNYAEFLNLIIPESNSYLRTSARDRLGRSYLSSSLSYDVEYSLAKVLEKEVELVKNVDFTLTDLRSRYDFNIADIFATLDNFNLNYLSVEK